MKIKEIVLTDQHSKKCDMIFKNMPQGFALHKIITDSNGKPIDYAFLEINKAYELLTGLKAKNILGKTVKQVLPKTEQYWIDTFGKVALTGESCRFENYSVELDKYYDVSAFSPKHNIFATIFTDITERKKSEDEIKQSKAKLEALSKEYDTLFEGSQDCLFLVDVIGDKTFKYRRSNLSHQKVTGIKLEELRGKTPVEVAGSNEGATIEARYAECLKARQSIVYEETLNLKLGKQTWHTTLTPIFVNNKIVNLVGSCHDITKRKEIEEAVFNDRELLKTTLLSVDDGVISTDNLGNVIIFNQKAEQITGLVASDCIGKNLDDVLSITDEFGKKRYNITQQMLLNKKNEKIPAYLIVRTKKGKRILVEISISKIIQTDNNISGLVLAFRNYESKKIKEEKIKTLSNTDHLTKLYNRRYFEKETVKLNNSNVLPLSILMIDINGLKLINDAFGHKYGDIVLKQAANIFKNCCKNKGFAARVGGDEFVVVLPHCDEIDSKKIVNKINKNIEIKSKQNQKNLGVILSASIGLATKISKEQDMEEVFKEAEDNMYRYKLSESASIKSKTIDIILNTLYEKNKMEMYHSKRVSMLSYDIASKLDLGKEQINEIKLAGLMHDIGKIGVAETILNKTGPLTEIERAEINKHAEIGYRILKASNEFFKIAVYLLEHHERWDGKGYPNKLAGEQISLPARIIAVADAYDAMTSNRFYRNSLTKEQALKEILACSGKQFDPNIARIFVEKVLEEKWNIE